MHKLAIVLSFISAVFSAAVKSAIDLKPVWGFKFCSHLDGSAFDMNSLVNYQTLAPYLTSDDDPDLKLLAETKKPRSLSETFTYFREAVDIIAKAISEGVQEREIIDVVTFFDSRSGGKDFADPDAARRFACLSVAEGIHAYAPLVSNERNQKILQFVDSEKYFGEQLSFSPFDIVKAQKELALHADKAELVVELPESHTVDINAYGKLAFVLMVHKDLDNVVEILQDVAAAKSTVLVHVDGNNPELKKDLAQWLESEYENGHFDPGRVQIMEKSFRGVWAHSSLIFMQIEAMFQLLNMNEDWEYVINMSGNDVLLVDHSQIYSQLSLHGDANWIEERFNKREFRPYNGIRRYHPYHPYHPYNEICQSSPHRESEWNANTREISRVSGGIDGNYFGKTIAAWKPFCSAFVSSSGTKTGPFADNKFDRRAPVCYVQSHQWMILHRSTPEIMRESPSAAMFLAFAEFEMCPDESYIARLLNFIPMYDEDSGAAHTFRIVNNNKRFLEWDSVHPRLLNIHDKSLLADAVARGKIIARKVDIQFENELLQWIRTCRAANWSGELCTGLKNLEEEFLVYRDSTGVY